MSTKDVVKLLLELLFAVAVVGLLCYARVDLGLSQDEINDKLTNWLGQSGLIIGVQALVVVVFVVGYRIWRHKSGKAD